MISRVLEPEVMDTWEDAIEYDAMDFLEVNSSFANRALELAPSSGLVLDVGTGTARIPILIARENPNLYFKAIDLSSNMLKLGELNVLDADLGGKILLQLVDAKTIPYPDNQFDMLICNSLVHHIPDPSSFLKEVNRILKPNAGLLIRDLIRPKTKKDVETLVGMYAADGNDRQKKLYEDSLCAAFTMEEVAALIEKAGIHGTVIVQSSDRHWSAERKWYREMKKDFPLPQS